MVQTIRLEFSHSFLLHGRTAYPEFMQVLKKIFRLCALASALLFSFGLHAQAPQSADAKSTPVIDGALGSCSADFIIHDSAGAPVYAATIRVHIAYGFLNAHRLDLEVGTNAAGQARFTGLPERTKQGLFFQAAEGNREGSAFDDPTKTCKANFTVVLVPKTH